MVDIPVSSSRFTSWEFMRRGGKSSFKGCRRFRLQGQYPQFASGVPCIRCGGSAVSAIQPFL